MKKLMLLAFIGLLFTSCESSMQVVSDSDKSANFDSYRTFQILPWPEELNQLVSKTSQMLVDESIATVLTRYGYTQVEQNADLALGLAQYAYVFEGGQLALEGDAKELKGNEHVRAAYLGT